MRSKTSQARREHGRRHSGVHRLARFAIGTLLVLGLCATGASSAGALIAPPPGGGTGTGTGTGSGSGSGSGGTQPLVVTNSWTYGFEGADGGLNGNTFNPQHHTWTGCWGYCGSAGFGNFGNGASADGELGLGATAFGVATSEDDWQVGETFQAPQSTGVNLQVVALVFMPTMVEGVSGAGVSCASTQVGWSDPGPGTTDQMLSCLSLQGLTVSVPVPSGDLSSEDASEAADLASQAQAAAQAFQNGANWVSNVEAYLEQQAAQDNVSLTASTLRSASEAAYTTDLLTGLTIAAGGQLFPPAIFSWTGAVDPGQAVSFSVDPQVAVQDYGAGTEINLADALVIFQVTEQYTAGRSSQTFAPAEIGQPTDQVSASSFSTAASVSVDPSSAPLPSGITASVTPAGGIELSGVPAAGSEGPHQFTLDLFDGSGALVGQLAATMTIAPPLQLAPTGSMSWEAGVLPNAAERALPVSTQGGVQCCSWSISPQSVDGGATRVSLSWTAGTASPPLLVTSGAAIVPGTYHFTVEAWDLDTVNPPSVPVTLTVSAPAVDTSTLPGATGPHLSCNRYGCWKQPGIPYQAQLSASGGLSPYWWTLTSGALPPGLSLSPGGAITGTPTADGTWTFTVEVVDQNGIAAQKTLALTVG